MREEFRRIGGDAAVEGLAARQPARPQLAQDVGGRAEPAAGGPGGVLVLAERERARPGDRDAAAAMYERLDDLGIDFSVVYPTAGLGYHRMPDTRLRRAICRAYNVFAADQFRGLGDRIIPAAIIPMYTPEEAIEELEFASRAARLQGRHDRRPHAPPGARARRGAPRRLEAGRVVRRHRHRQPPRLRSGVGQVPRAPDGAELPQRRPLDPAAQLAVELLLQPHRPLRLGRPRRRQGDVLRRRHPPLPRPELRLPRGRGGLGVHALRGPDRPLGEAQPAGASRARTRASWIVRGCSTSRASTAARRWWRPWAAAMGWRATRTPS